MAKQKPTNPDDALVMVSLTLRRGLLNAIDAAATADNRNRSNYITTVLTRDIAQKQTAPTGRARLTRLAAQDGSATIFSNPNIK